MAAVHLIPADEAVRRGGYSTLVAACGAEVTECTLPADSDPKYCPECVRAAADWNFQTSSSEMLASAPAC